MRVVGYLVAGYLVLVAVVSALAPFGAAAPFLSLALAAGVFVALRRSRRRPRLLGKLDPGAVEDVVAPLVERADRLEERLPLDPLESDAFVEARHALLNEPEDVRLAADGEYAAARERLDALRGELEGLVRARSMDGDPMRRIPALDRGLTELESFASELAARGAASRDAAEAARSDLERAEAVLDSHEVRSTPERVVSARAAAREAAEALAPGQERPLAARALAARALDEAQAAVERAREDAALPAELRTRRAAFSERQRTLAESLDRAAANLRLASSRSARACVVDVAAADAAARDLALQADDAARNAAEHESAGELRRAVETISTAGQLLHQATKLVRHVEEQLADLAGAALAARDSVRDAEAATDAAWAAMEASPDAEAGRREVVREARRLAEQAREALGAPAPDWFAVADLADRAIRLATTAREAPAAGTGDLAAARIAATAARDEAWAQALSGYAGGSLVAAQEAETAFDEALALEAASGATASVRARGRATAAFRRAEQIALQAAAEAGAERAARSAALVERGARPPNDAGGLVGAVALAALLGAAFGE